MTSTYGQKLNSCNIESLLRDSIHILCSNSIPFNSIVSIDALIGITVDNSQVMLIKLDEKVTKPTSTGPSGCKTAPTHTSVDSAADNVDYYPCGDVEQSQDVSDYEQFDMNAMQDIKVETVDNSAEYLDGNSDDIYYSGDYDDINEQLQDDEAFQEHETDTDYVDTESQNLLSDRKALNLHVGDDLHCRPSKKSFSKLTRATYTKHRRQHPTYSIAQQQRRKVVKQDCSDMSHVTDSQQVSNEAPTGGLLANECATVYTCSVCGQVIRHLSSFLRHKRQHEGVVYRCDICNTVFSRQDTLKAHRRKCLAKVELGLI